MSNSLLVTAAKPKKGGAIYTAPLGTKLPLDAIAKLDPAFKSLGYVSDDGLTNENSITSENIKAWGGDVVNSVQTDSSDSFTYKLIEGLNIDVLKEIYGDNNVSGTLEKGITINVNSSDKPEHVIVIDMILKGGHLKRIVLPVAKITAVDPITYKDNENVGYGVTVQALPGPDGDTHKEYIAKGA